MTSACSSPMRYWRSGIGTPAIPHWPTGTSSTKQYVNGRTTSPRTLTNVSVILTTSSFFCSSVATTSWMNLMLMMGMRAFRNGFSRCQTARDRSPEFLRDFRALQPPREPAKVFAKPRERATFECGGRHVHSGRRAGDREDDLVRARGRLGAAELRMVVRSDCRRLRRGRRVPEHDRREVLGRSLVEAERRGHLCHIGLVLLTDPDMDLAQDEDCRECAGE